MWIYDQNGVFYDPQGNFFSKAYSGGNLGKDPDFINKPEFQHIDRKGVICAGFYTIGVPCFGFLGNFAIPLYPDPDTNLFGRGAFFIRGNKTLKGFEGSEGCIITEIMARQQIYVSADNRLLVTPSIEYVPKNLHKHHKYLL